MTSKWLHYEELMIIPLNSVCIYFSIFNTMAAVTIRHMLFQNFIMKYC